MSEVTARRAAPPSGDVAEARPAAPTDASGAVLLPEGVGDGDGALDEFSEKLAAFNAFRKSDEAAADAILESIGATGTTETEIVQQMAVPRPLYRPVYEFEQAHRQVMKGLEVLQRNGARNVRVPRLGPLRPVAAFLVQLLTRFIVRSYTQSLSKHLLELYTRRETWCRPATSERRALQRARMDAQRLLPGLKAKLGLPTFLVGGAFISTLLSAARSGADTVTRNGLLIALATVLLLLLFLGAAWAALRGAATARHRINLTTGQPVKTLYSVVGAAGRPPKDHAVQFALGAILAMAVAWLVIPAGLVLVFMNT